tara:strand:+ start:5283 stop:5789 length:507 start_codon:yes stop_codon:yes gene_type:complete
MVERSDEEKEARVWSWVSLIIALLLLLLFAAGGAWPVVIVQILSGLGSVLFLFGSDNLKNCAMVMLFVSAGMEISSGVMLAIFGIILVSSPYFGLGWGILIGLYALILAVPTLAIGWVDLYTAYRIRESLYGDEAKERREAAKEGRPESLRLTTLSAEGKKENPALPF